MGDDWRLRLDLHEERHAGELTERIGAELEHDLEEAFHDRVIVSRDGAEVFLYANTREQATKAENLIHSLASEHGWEVDSELQRWHSIAEQWEDPDKPLPSSQAERAAEHDELVRSEDAESRTEGFPEWEVRVQCASHHDAKRLADRIQREAPAGSKTTVEVSGREVLEVASDAGRVNPFVVF